MAIAILTLKDAPGDRIDVTLEFEPAIRHDSAAHSAAVDVLGILQRQLGVADDESED